MLINNWSCSSTSSRLLQPPSQSNRIDYENNHLYSRRRKLKVFSTLASLRVGTDVILEIAQNKVLIAAAGCAAIGQLTKPFTASILYQRDFDLKAALQAGGFPSTHSSAAVATATSIGLERGFSDSIFGLAVVYAALTMYDAQGVRREVGVHARTLNKVLSRRNQLEKYPTKDAKTLLESSSSKKLLSNLESGNSSKVVNSSSCLTEDIEKGSESEIGPVSGLLKESIGHTEIEVAAGALLGLLGGLAVYSL